MVAGMISAQVIPVIPGIVGVMVIIGEVAEVDEEQAVEVMNEEDVVAVLEEVEALVVDVVGGGQEVLVPLW